MSVRRLLAIALGIAAVSPSALAKKKAPAAVEDDDEDDSADEADDEGSSDEGEDEGDEEEDEDDAAPAKKKKKADEPFVKQNLTGHDLGTKKKENSFEKDRFYVDKVDTKKTAKGTLVQGSISSSSFAYTERGGTYAVTPLDPNAPPPPVDNAAPNSRLFTELRLQTDFRHISASRWDARIDARARFVNTPDNGPMSVEANHIQSGFNGTDEYDLRELWLFHSGKRADVFLGRQYVADLGAVKFDGLRVDYASSRKLTLIGFGGLYPLRGSRSLTTDYQPLKDNDGNDAGRFVGVGGFGGAYRTLNTYGALGGVVLYPVHGEQPRVFVTSTGYWRSGSAVDVYHYALVDLYGSQGAGLTNLSAGVNYKPSPRLRATASFNRVDVDTLAVQANAFLSEPDPSVNTIVESETYFRRLASNVGRAGLSVGLGQLQRFEVSTGVAYRWRPSVAIPVGDGSTTLTLQAARGVEVYGSIVDRRSFKQLRLGLDVTRTLGIGDIAYQRSSVLSVRAHASREVRGGRGEWEAEVDYNMTKDSASGTTCLDVTTCYGASKGSILSAGGSLYYRLKRDWFAIGNVFLSRQTLTYLGNGTMTLEDPPVTSFTGYVRIAYRF